MKHAFIRWTCVIVVLIAAGVTHARPTPVGTAFTYQGQLKQGGNPVNASADFQFRLFDVETNGTPLGAMFPENNVTVTEGQFTVDIDFGALAFNGEARWLEIAVRSPAGSGSFTTLLPRQPVNPAPMAQFALNAFGPNLTNLNAGNITSGTINVARMPAGGNWSMSSALNLDSNSLVVDAVNNRVGIGTASPNVALEVAGVARFTGSGGFSIGGNPNQIAIDTLGANNQRFRFLDSSNSYTGLRFKQVSIGDNFGDLDAPANGMIVQGDVGIGTSSPGATLHVVEGTSGTGLILPGLRVFQNSESPNVVGGSNTNTVTGGAVGATIGGGGNLSFPNRVTDEYGTVGGGQDNLAGNSSGTSSDSSFATVGGGRANLAIGEYSTIGGGISNTAIGRYSTVGGGSSNDARNLRSTVSGGGVNTALGEYSTVPGGNGNIAGGDYSLAAGRRAEVRNSIVAGNSTGDQGTFVWADSTDASFTSTGPDQFLIRATGGVGIGTSTPDVSYSLTVNGSATGFPLAGTVYRAGSGNVSLSFPGPTDTANFDIWNTNNGWIRFGTSGQERMRITNAGRVGIGRLPLTRTLEVEGDASKTTSSVWAANSDRRIKTDIRDLDNALDIISRIRPVAFRYTDLYRAAHPSIEDVEYYNVIAQEFAEVFPDSVKLSGEELPNGEPILQVDVHPMLIHAVAAIQQLRTEKDSEIAHLRADHEAENTALRDRIESLEQSMQQLLALYEKGNP